MYIKTNSVKLSYSKQKLEIGTKVNEIDDANL